MSIVTTSILIVFIYMTAWFVASLIQKRNDLADTAWGAGFVVLAWYHLFVEPDPSDRSFLLALLVTFWGARLVWHINRRNHGKSEDFRYEAWRKQWGSYVYIRSYLQVFLLQGALMLLIAGAFIFAIRAPYRVPLGAMDMVGLAVWMVGFFFETVGDWQLMQFKKNPKSHGKLMTTGVWKYTRHPNYFGEVTQWWGIYILAAAVLPSAWALISPLTITVLILFVSGVPLLEMKYKGRADWEDYVSRTSMFIPWFPGKKK